MTDINRFYIDGAWVVPDSTQTMPILNPSTNGQIGTLTLGNAADVDRAVAAAKAAAGFANSRTVITEIPGQAFR